MRTSFYKHIKAMETAVIALGEGVEKAVMSSIRALQDRDLEWAQRIVRDDAIINAQRWKIENDCVNLIALQQPVASDLREMIAILNIVSNLERMGDHAEGIAKIVLLLGKDEVLKPHADLPAMAETAMDMLRQSLQAFIQRDAKAAGQICDMDDKVDGLHDKVYHELLDKMIEDPQLVNPATYQIWAAHNLERIADRVTNICERIVYLVTGAMNKELNISRY